MLAPTDGAEFKEPFKNVSVPAIRWWLHGRSLIVREAKLLSCSHHLSTGTEVALNGSSIEVSPRKSS